MPQGTNIISAESCGVSAWTKTAKVTAQLPDGSLKRYFLKVSGQIQRPGQLSDKDSVLPGRAPELCAKANFTLPMLSTSWFLDSYPSRRDGANTRMAGLMCTSFLGISTIWTSPQLQILSTLSRRW